MIGTKYNREKYLKNRDKVLARAKLYYLENREKIEKYRKRYKVSAANKLKTNKKRIYAAQKKLIFDNYGNKCVLCGELDIEFLELDHINGGGCKHLEEIKLQGKRMHQWVIENNFPPIFQVLCCNCNWLKHLSTLISSGTQSAMYSKTAHHNLRKKVFNILGNQCKCCGEDRFDLLTVEHLHNDGRVERKLYGREGYYRRIANGLSDPSRYETLCRNCNFAKGRNGYCPHFPTLKQLLET